MYMLVPMYQVTICVPFVRKYLNATDVHVGYLYMIRYYVLVQYKHFKEYIKQKRYYVL